VLQDREDNGDELHWEEGWPVLFWGIDPSEQEVVITVGETLSLVEEFLSGSFVELGSGGIAQGQVRNVEVGVSGPLDPLTELVSLDSVHWPVPSVLGLYDVEFSVESESHGGVTGV